MLSARRTRERMTYVVIISVKPGLSKTSPHSAMSASSVVPCCINPVHATSGTSVKPFLEIFAFVALFTSQTRVTGFSGKTPGPSCRLICHSALSNFRKITRGKHSKTRCDPHVFILSAGCNSHPIIVHGVCFRIVMRAPLANFSVTLAFISRYIGKMPGTPAVR